MSFTDAYLALCWQGRSLWSQKRTYAGDWYLTGDPLELRLVGHDDVGRVRFSSADIAYVPDTDDLLELLDNQVKAAGADPAHKVFTIRYDPADQWQLEVEYGDFVTVVMEQESFHSLLLKALPQMASPPE